MNMMQQSKTELLTNEEAPDRLSIVLQNPSAEWSDIRAAMKAQGAGGFTNLAVVNALSSKGSDQTDKSSDTSNDKRPMRSKYIEPTASADDDGQAAKEKDYVVSSASGGDDTLMPLGHRRATLASQDSNNSGSTTRPSLRTLPRQKSRRRMRRTGSSRRMRLLRSSVNTSIKSLTLDSLAESESASGSLHNSSTDFNNSSSFKLAGGGVVGFEDSVNIMDFGISQRRLREALDGSDRSCSSLDTGMLDDLQEEYNDNDGDLSGSRQTLLVSWQHDSSVSGGDDGDFRGSSRRALILSWRQDSTMSGLDESSVRSEGDLNSYYDVDSCGFLDWPAAAREGDEEGESDAIKTGEDTVDRAKNNDVEGGTRIIEDEIQHKVQKQEEEEEWNIEDYEGGGDDSHHPGRNKPRAHSISTSTMGLAVTNTFKKFTRSNASSNVTQDDMDLVKIKEALPTIIAKNRQQHTEVDDTTTGKKKRAGSISVISRFQQSMEAELKKDKKKPAERMMSRKEVIWAKDSVNFGSNDEYKKLYALAPKKKAPQRNSWNVFERLKGHTIEDDFSERRSSN